MSALVVPAAAMPSSIAPSSSTPFPRGKPLNKSSEKPHARKASTISSSHDDPVKTTSSPHPPLKKQKTNPVQPAGQTSQRFNPFTAFTQKDVIVGIVKFIQRLDLVVALPNDKFGFVSITEISPLISKRLEEFAQDSEDEHDSESGLPKLSNMFTQGQLILVKIIQIHVNDKSNSTRISLTVQPSQVAESMSLQALKPGMLVQGYVKSEQDHGYLVDLGFSETANTSVFLPSSSLPTDEPRTALVDGLVSLFRIQTISGRTITVHLLPPSTDFNSLPPKSQWPASYVATPFALDLTSNKRPEPPIQTGEIVRGTVVEHRADGAMKVGLVLPGDADKSKKKTKSDDTVAKYKFIGLVPPYHISDINLSHPEKRFPEGSTHKFRVLGVDGARFILTAKKTLINSDLPLVTDYNRDRVGSIAHGTIVSVREDSCVVQFFNYVRAYVPIREMSHEFLTSTSDFRCGQPVKCRIFYANADDKKMTASFLLDNKKAPTPAIKKPVKAPVATPNACKKSDQDPHENIEAADAKKSKEVPAASMECKPKNPKLRKSDQIIRKLDFEKLANGVEIHSADDVTVGMTLNGYVINIKDKAGVFVALSPKVVARIKIGELSNDFVKEWKELVKQGDVVSCRVLSNENGHVELTRKPCKKTDGKRRRKEAESSHEELEESDDESSSDGSDDGTNSEGEHGVDVAIYDKPASTLNGIQVAGRFDWSTTLSDDDEDEEEEPELATVTSKNLNVFSQKGPELDEQAIVRREATLLDEPQLAADYERLLVGTPNSSYLWIKYMAFQLKLADIAKARDIAERAVQTIHYREEQEKLNVWVAWMNLENQYGDAASLEALFKRATQYNEPMAVYQHLASIYSRSDMHEKAVETYEEMVLKDRETPQTWIQYGAYLYGRKETHDQARALLQRGLNSKSIPKTKHIELILQFAILEFKHADIERARTIFEGILANYPKRVDIWSVYLDQQIKTGEMAAVRQLFDRIITLKFSAKKMKFFFKKYLEFEKKFGDDCRVAFVKTKAWEYVEALNRAG